MIRALLVAAAASAFFPAAAIAQENDPQSIVERVMQLELWSIATTAPYESQPFSDTSLDLYFTAAFAEDFRAVMALQEQRNEPLIDGDLIANSQEYCPLVEIDIDRIGVGGGVGIVAVTFRSQWCWADLPPEISGRVDRVQFRLIQEDGMWKIDDFDSGGSVRALFAELMH